MNKYVLHMILKDKNKVGRHVGWIEANSQLDADKYAVRAWNLYLENGSYTDFSMCYGFKATLESEYRY